MLLKDLLAVLVPSQLLSLYINGTNVCLCNCTSPVLGMYLNYTVSTVSALDKLIDDVGVIIVFLSHK